MNLRICALVGLLLLATGPLRAGIEFSGMSILEYERQLDGPAEDGLDAFDVSRIYLTAKAPLGDRSYFLYRTDIGRFNDNTSLAVRTK